MADPCFPGAWAPVPLSYFTTVMSVILTIVITTGNFLIVVAIVKDPHKKLRKPFAYFLANLALSDVFVGIIAMPVSIMFHYLEAQRRINMTTIYIVHITYFLSLSASLFSMTAMCFDRYYVFVSLSTNSRQFTKSRCILISIGIWVLAAAFTGFYFLFGYVTLLVIYAHISFVCIFGITLLTYLKIMKNLKKVSRVINRRLGPSGEATPENVSSNTRGRASSVAASESRRNQSTKEAHIRKRENLETISEQQNPRQHWHRIFIRRRKRHSPAVTRSNETAERSNDSRTTQPKAKLPSPVMEGLSPNMERPSPRNGSLGSNNSPSKRRASLAVSNWNPLRGRSSTLSGSEGDEQTNQERRISKEERRRLKQQRKSISEQAKKTRHFAQERKITRVFLTMLSTFLCTYFPALILVYILQFCLSCSCDFRHILRDIVFVLVPSSSGLNPLICILKLPYIKEAVIAIFKFRRRTVYSFSNSNFNEQSNHDVAVARFYSVRSGNCEQELQQSPVRHHSQTNGILLIKPMMGKETSGDDNNKHCSTNKKGLELKLTNLSETESAGNNQLERLNHSDNNSSSNTPDGSNSRLNHPVISGQSCIICDHNNQTQCDECKQLNQSNHKFNSQSFTTVLTNQTSISCDHNNEKILVKLSDSDQLNTETDPKHGATVILNQRLITCDHNNQQESMVWNHYSHETDVKSNQSTIVLNSINQDSRQDQTALLDSTTGLRSLSSDIAMGNENLVFEEDS